MDAITVSGDTSLLIAGGYNGTSCDFGNGITLTNSNSGTPEAFSCTTEYDRWYRKICKKHCIWK